MFSKPTSIKKGDFACRWLGNVDMHMFATFDQNNMSACLLIDHGRINSHTDYSADPRVMQFTL